MCVYIYICVYICMCMYVYVYIYIYIERRSVYFTRVESLGFRVYRA